MNTRYGPSVVTNLISPPENEEFRAFLPARMAPLFPNEGDNSNLSHERERVENSKFYDFK